MLYILLILLLLVCVKLSKRKFDLMIMLWLIGIILFGLIIIRKNEVPETMSYGDFESDDVFESVSGENVKELYVHYIDVGQADSIFIDYGDYEILIDGGNNGDGDLVVDYISPFTDEIDLLIASHPHEDHIGGLDHVIDSYDIVQIIDSGYSLDTKTYSDYHDAARLDGASYNEDSNTTIAVDEHFEIEIFDTGDDYKNTNDHSVVVKLTYMDTSFLFTGDMEEKAEEEILSYDIDSDVLKAAHHGSKTSSSKEFLEKVSPEIVVVSVGKDNKYNHPSLETMERFEEYTNEIYLTSDQGHIVLKSTGDKVLFVDSY